MAFASENLGLGIECSWGNLGPYCVNPIANLFTGVFIIEMLHDIPACQLHASSPTPNKNQNRGKKHNNKNTKEGTKATPKKSLSRRLCTDSTHDINHPVVKLIDFGAGHWSKTGPLQADEAVAGRCRDV